MGPVNQDIAIQILRESTERLRKEGAENFSACGWARIRRVDPLFVLYDEADAAGRVETITGPEAEALVAQSITVVDDPREPAYEQTFALTTDGRIGSFEESWFDPFNDTTEPAVLSVVDDERMLAAVAERIEADECRTARQWTLFESRCRHLLVRTPHEPGENGRFCRTGT